MVLVVALALCAAPTMAAVGTAPPMELATALEVFLEDAGVNVDSALRSQLADANALPLGVQTGIAAVLEAYAAYDAAAQGLSSGAWSPGVEAPVRAGQAGLLSAAGQLEDALNPQSTSSSGLTFAHDLVVRQFGPAGMGTDTTLGVMAHVGMDGSVEHDATFETCTTFGFNVSVAPVLSIDLRRMDNTYTDDFRFQLDTCGDDNYLNNAGGSGTGACGSMPGGAALIDLYGDDEYGSAAAPRSCGANGGAFLGAGMLLDLQGDDVLAAGFQGVNGGGNRGVGLVVNLAGDDTYTAANIAANGGGTQGSGLLIDIGGSDSYTAGDSGTNGGANIDGRGALIDVEGNDVYTAGTNGANGGAAVGVGLLLDRLGVDTYLDADGGSGTDVTVVPKGLVGAQVDA